MSGPPYYPTRRARSGLDIILPHFRLAVGEGVLECVEVVEFIEDRDVALSCEAVPGAC